MQRKILVFGMTLAILAILLILFNEISKPPISDEDRLIGIWTNTSMIQDSIRTSTYIFLSDKTFEQTVSYKGKTDMATGIWEVIEPSNELVLYSEIQDLTIFYDFSNNDKTLTIRDDTGATIDFTKQ